MTESKFFVGIGAQKSGTSWLWEYLMSHPQVGFSPIKELHFFDSKYTDAHARVNLEFPRIKRNIRQLLRYLPPHPVQCIRMLRHYFGTLAFSDKSYHAYLRTALASKDIAGEITPAYTMLDHTGIGAIERVLERPRYLLILRNPADRFWSHIRYRARWKNDLNSVSDLTDLLTDDAYLLRSGYARIYRLLEEVVADGRLHVIFYESLFDPASTQMVCDGVCDFLGVTRHIADPKSRVNVGDRWPDDKLDRLKLTRALREEYLFFFNLFSQTLPECWKKDIADLD